MLEKIPKVIHQIWIQGEDEIPEDLMVYKNKIQQLHPDWKYILWDEISILQFLKKTNKEWFKMYYNFTYLHQKVDYTKLLILYTYGGIFIDMDAYTIKKLDGLIDKYGEYDLIVSYAKEINPLVNYSVCRKFGQCLNNGIFLGKPNTDILSYMIDNISYECSTFKSKIDCIANTTGPVYFNKNLFNYINNDDNKNKSTILILDSDYLEPCMLDICEVTGNTYIKHVHSQSWINAPVKEFIKLYIKYTKLFNIILLLIFVLIIYFIFSYSKTLIPYIKNLKLFKKLNLKN